MKKGLWYCLVTVFLITGIALVPAASQADVIFQDGFESGNITAGGWTSSGDMTVDTNSYSGNYAARIDDSGYFLKVVDTTGYTDIGLEYARYTYGYDWGENLSVYWSTDGSNWNLIESYTGGWAATQVSLPAGAAQQPTLHILFYTEANGYYERFRIDAVTVSGTSGTQGPLPPQFTSDPFSTSDATVDSAYFASIAGSATDPNPGDTLTYSKVGGPVWLSVAADGALSGTPQPSDVGENSFTVQVSDQGGLTDTATLIITVVEGSTTCLPEVTDFTSQGPFDYTYRNVNNVKMYVPDDVPAGCKVPVIHLANGTGASCSMYSDILQHYASHGFIAACYEDSNTGQGTQAISAINTVTSLYPDLADTKYGFTGHSQGGGGAIMAVYRAEQEWGSSRTYTGFGIEPAHGYGDSPYNWEDYYAQITSPISMFNGSSDLLVSASWVRDGYEALSPNLEKAWYEAVGASHMTPIPQDEASEFGLAWFRWQLLGDSNACQYFKNMPNSYYWRLQETDNLSSCD